MNELYEIERKVVEHVPPAEPPTCCWLRSDASASYCPDCAWKARWVEMPTVGPCPERPEWFRLSEFDELLEEGIDGSHDGYSDTVEYCETCGCLLSHLLTEYGQINEFEHYKEFPISSEDIITAELSYNFTRICMNLDWDGADQSMVQSAMKIGTDILSAIEENASSKLKVEARIEGEVQ